AVRACHGGADTHAGRACAASHSRFRPVARLPPRLSADGVHWKTRRQTGCLLLLCFPLVRGLAAASSRPPLITLFLNKDRFQRVREMNLLTTTTAHRPADSFATASRVFLPPTLQPSPP